MLESSYRNDAVRKDKNKTYQQEMFVIIIVAPSK